jgi:hypothetical protein
MDERQNSQEGLAQGTRGWLRPYPWEDIVGSLTSFWHISPDQLEVPATHQVRELWKREGQRDLTLAEALRLCRKCQGARPFGKYDCESFVLVARDMIKPFLEQMSSPLAAAVVTILGDYVRGAGDEVEMQQALHLIMEKFAEFGPSDHSASPGGL